MANNIVIAGTQIAPVIDYKTIDPSGNTTWPSIRAPNSVAERMRFEDLDTSKSYIVVSIVEGTQYISAPFPIAADLTHINAIDSETRLLPEFYLFQQ